MKTIGLLGGMSWESTREYYRLLNETVRARLGGLHSAKIILYSFDFAEIAELQNNNRWEEAALLLSQTAKNLEMAGAEILLIGTNTMHKIADRIEQAVSIPLVHIADAVATPIKAKKIKKVGLLGTEFTMRGEFYKERLARHGIEVVIPEENDFVRVNDVIFGELCQGVFSKTSLDEFLAIIERLKARGAEGVIFGCTEIGLLVPPERSPIPAFDSMKAHVEAAAEAAFGQQPIKKAS